MARNYKAAKQEAAQLALDTGCTALYVRVSTERQADEGFSLEAQQKQLRAFCEAHSWVVCEEHIYIDAGISGKSTERVAFQAMLEAAKGGKVRRIVAMKLDRLARNVKDFLTTVEQLKEWDCALVLVKESFDTSTPHGKFALTMFAAMAELEATTITERMLSGKAQNASKGGYNGSRVPMGYVYNRKVIQGSDGKERIEGEFTINEAQAATVRRIFDMFLAGHSLNAIARRFNAEGVPTATGDATWGHYGVSHILRNGFYAGVAQWNGVEVATGGHPAIISREVYDQAQAIIKSRTPRQRVDLAKAGEL